LIIWSRILVKWHLYQRRAKVFSYIHGAMKIQVMTAMKENHQRRLKGAKRRRKL